MKRGPRGGLLTLGTVLAVASCSGPGTSTTSIDPNSSISAVVYCGTGLGIVRTHFKETTVVGVSADQTHANHPDPGVQQSYNETFKLDRGDTSTPLTVTVTPQRGECRTAIVNATGDQLASYSGPKEFTYSGVLNR